MRRRHIPHTVTVRPPSDDSSRRKIFSFPSLPFAPVEDDQMAWTYSVLWTGDGLELPRFSGQ